jgi:hypothetical protein
MGFRRVDHVELHLAPPAASRMFVRRSTAAYRRQVARSWRILPALSPMQRGDNRS